MTTISSSIEQLQKLLAAEVVELANANISADSPSARVSEIMKRLAIARQTEAELSGRNLTDKALDAAADRDADQAAAVAAKNACIGAPEKFDATYHEAREKLAGAVRSVKHARVEKLEQFEQQCNELKTNMRNTFDALTSAYHQGMKDGRSGRHTPPADKHFGAPIGGPFRGIKGQ